MDKLPPFTPLESSAIYEEGRKRRYLLLSEVPKLKILTITHRSLGRSTESEHIGEG